MCWDNALIPILLFWLFVFASPFIVLALVLFLWLRREERESEADSSEAEISH